MHKIFHEKTEEGIFLISSSEYGTSMALGKPTANSYLVVGSEKALLIDLAVNVEGIREYAEKLAGLPVQVVITHCHPDHICCMSEFEEVSFHEADRNFPLCFLPGMKPPKKLPAISYINEGSVLDLGGRTLRVFHIPGHTMGSILLLDELTGTLFSGDTVARRLLYGLTGCPPLEEFCEALKRLEQYDIRHVQSAHDRTDLGKAYIAHMISLIKDELPAAEKHWRFPAFPRMLNLVHGTEDSIDFFDCAVPEKIVTNRI